ncbi:hypothetical protein HA402_013525 [Bradysia odoriphaga]|nr:hypothetical protein HA402_013525 [Bradysia odoriphaga]
MASALEHYVNNVCSYSASGNYRELIDYLNGSTELLAKNGNILDNVLETLDNHQHSLGVLYVLVAKFTNLPANNPAPADAERLIKLVRDFMAACNPSQVRLSLQTFGELCHLFTSYLVKRNDSIQGVKIMAQAVEKIRGSDTQLTSVHADLCQLSLCAKIFNSAIACLDLDITSIASTEDGNHDAKYFLLYYYYGGMIYTAVKNYERALYFFEVAITTPAVAMSHIMLESYKKYILVSLILHGTIIPFPKSNSSPVISRFMKPLSHVYYELAKAYGTSSSEELRVVINKNRDVYTRDINLGLVKQVASSLYKKNIQRLTKTFLTLSLADVASRVQLSGPVEAEKYILKMIKSGEIFASINQKDGMVVFKDDPEKYNTPEMFLKIQEDISKVMDLHKQIAINEESIMLNPLYVKKATGNQDDEIGSCQSKSYAGENLPPRIVVLRPIDHHGHNTLDDTQNNLDDANENNPINDPVD